MDILLLFINIGEKMGKAKFKHRIAMGIWINDIKNVPMKKKNWPDVSIDEKTLEDYVNMLDLQKEAGYNAFDIFGLLVGHDWPPDVISALKDGRKELVEKMIDMAHDRGIKIIYGLGVYSWGFDKIIQYDPSVRGSNPSAMCGSKPESKKWQERIVDLIASNFDIDGFHLESSDQGRCYCQECSKENDVQYYSRLNSQTAEYIRSKWPDKVLLVNDCGYMPWGDYVLREDYKYLFNLSKHINIFIDNGNHGLFIRVEDRKDFISGMRCDFGSAGGFWVYPPQRWNRLRWFLPYINRTGNFLKSLYNDGGKACEFYMGPTINPGVEANIMFGGLLLSNVERDNKDILCEVINKLYKPKTNVACNDLLDIFIHAEDAFFSNWLPDTKPFKLPTKFASDVKTLMNWSQKTPERTLPGELFLEPLVGNKAGDPIYLINNMNSDGRKKYKSELEIIENDINKFGNEFIDHGRIERIKICINSVINDLEFIENREV